ncbi:hypothetical protein RRG08_022078 [Elysia crispata]|uniref:Uncharacterized protein n=1 Tax=Elysia crispata TaxID=231223 RepID=A0AAE0Y1Q9_9GAST|nr:hypothetical protein RRG08_022078 [Elysia crispata]
MICRIQKYLSEEEQNWMEIGELRGDGEEGKLSRGQGEQFSQSMEAVYGGSIPSLCDSSSTQREQKSGRAINPEIGSPTWHLTPGVSQQSLLVEPCQTSKEQDAVEWFKTPGLGERTSGSYPPLLTFLASSHYETTRNQSVATPHPNSHTTPPTNMFLFPYPHPPSSSSSPPCLHHRLHSDQTIREPFFRLPRLEIASEVCSHWLLERPS